MATILALDDDPLNRLLLATVLRPCGHDVREASDGAEGLRAASETAFDLIFVDLGMPRMGGAAFLRGLRNDLHSDARVVLYTATRPDAAMRDFARLFSVAAILEKPSEPHEIVRVVHLVLAADPL